MELPNYSFWRIVTTDVILVLVSGTMQKSYLAVLRADLKL